MGRVVGVLLLLLLNDAAPPAYCTVAEELVEALLLAWPREPEGRADLQHRQHSHNSATAAACQSMALHRVWRSICISASVVAAVFVYRRVWRVHPRGKQL